MKIDTIDKFFKTRISVYDDKNRYIYIKIYEDYSDYFILNEFIEYYPLIEYLMDVTGSRDVFFTKDRYGRTRISLDINDYYFELIVDESSDTLFLNGYLSKLLGFNIDLDYDNEVLMIRDNKLYKVPIDYENFTVEPWQNDVIKLDITLDKPIIEYIPYDEDQLTYLKILNLPNDKLLVNIDGFIGEFNNYENMRQELLKIKDRFNVNVSYYIRMFDELINYVKTLFNGNIKKISNWNNLTIGNVTLDDVDFGLLKIIEEDKYMLNTINSIDNGKIKISYSEDDNEHEITYSVNDKPPTRIFVDNLYSINGVINYTKEGRDFVNNSLGFNIDYDMFMVNRNFTVTKLNYDEELKLYYSIDTETIENIKKVINEVKGKIKDLKVDVNDVSTIELECEECLVSIETDVKQVRIYTYEGNRDLPEIKFIKEKFEEIGFRVRVRDEW